MKQNHPVLIGRKITYNICSLLLAICCLLGFSFAQAQPKARSFNGTNSSLDAAGSAASLTASAIKTMECWVKLNDKTAVQEILSKSDLSIGIELLVYDNSLAFFCMTNSEHASFIKYPISNIQTGVWYHVAATWDGSTKESMRLYVNGVSVGTRSDIGDINTKGIGNPAGTFKIGRWSNNNPPRWLNGLVSEVKLWNQYRTDAQIRNEMFGSATNAPGLLAYYIKADNPASLSNLSNSVNAAANSALTQSNTTTVASPVQAASNAISLDGNTTGSGDYISIPTRSEYNFTTGTIECWVRPTNLTGNAGIISNRTKIKGSRYSFHMSATGIGMYDNTSYFTIPFTSTPGTWYHLAFVCTPTETKAYVNGTLIGTFKDGSRNVVINNALKDLPIQIGAADDAVFEPFGGAIDEVRIWNTARSEQQIKDHMNYSLKGTETGLIGLFNFDQGIGGGDNAGLVTVMDRSPLANNGNLVNFALTGTSSNYIARTLSALPLSPIVTAVTPTNAPVGASVKIHGLNFYKTATSNIVYFGGVKATVTAATESELSVNVPTGASHTFITVTNSETGLTGTAKAAFDPTFSNICTATPFTTSSFSAKADVEAGLTPRYVTVGDIDGDGKPDLVTTHSNGNNISVMRNISATGTLSAGSFAPSNSFAVSNQGLMGAELGDFDGDGKLDIVVTVVGGGNKAAILRNTSTVGSISFDAPVEFAVQNNPRHIAVGDIDGDGKLDIAVAHYGISTVAVLQNTSVKGTISFAPMVSLATPSYTWDPKIGDIDGDGKADLVVSSMNSNNISVFRNISSIGTLTSSSFAARVDVPVGETPYGVAIGDLDGDGKLDIAVANGAANTVSLLRNNTSSGIITAASFQRTDVAVGDRPRKIALGDVTGDGKTDLAVANESSHSLSVLANKSISGTLLFDDKVDFFIANFPINVLLVDLDGDGKLDIAANSNGTNSVSVARNILFSSFSGLAQSTTTFSSVCDNGTWQTLYSPSTREVIATIKSNGQALGDLSATVYVDAQPGRTGGTTGDIFMGRHFVIKPSTQPTGSVQVRLYFTDAEFNALKAADPRVQSIANLSVTKYSGPDEDGVFNSANGTLTYIPSEAITTGREFNANYLEFSITSFSEFWIHGGTRALPVKLTAFTAQKKNEGVQLQWRTEGEQNSSHFVVERSANGLNFTALGSVQSAGTTTQAKAYSYLDREPLTGRNYYRLQQVDLDGKREYSSVVVMNWNKDQDGIRVVVTPQAARQYKVYVDGVAGRSSFLVYDGSGKCVKTISVRNNTHSFEVDLSGFSSGIYLYQLVSEQGGVLASGKIPLQ